MPTSTVALVELVDWIDDRRNVGVNSGDLVESITWKLQAITGLDTEYMTDPMPIEAPDYPVLRRVLGQD